MNKNTITLSLSLVLFISFAVLAHDTTHIHPLITAKVAELIASTDVDNNKYEELYKESDAGRIYWGQDADAQDGPDTQVKHVLDEVWLGKDQIQEYNNYNNVIDGTVQEDFPVNKTIYHFYHATSGMGLHLNGAPAGGRCDVRSMDFFNKAVMFYGGYTEQSKQQAYFNIGQSLHLVEDMSAPAHIHNDAHLIFSDSEKDDYERYLTFQKMNDADLSGFFGDIDSITRVDNPWVDIWGTANSGSLARATYDKTTYQGTLTFPRSVAVDFGILFPAGPVPFTSIDRPGGPFVVINDADEGTASGELAEMFPCEDSAGQIDNDLVNCLHWVEDEIMELAHWRINSVGDFQHQYFTGSRNAWWPVKYENNPGGIIDNEVTIGGGYYIENLSNGNSQDNPFGDPIIPANFRGGFGLPGSPTIPNDKSILQIQGETLLKPAVKFGAGFAQYWFDVANTPPYLQSVEVKQAPKESAHAVTVYKASWELLPDNIATILRDDIEIIDDTYHIASESTFDTLLPHTVSIEMEYKRRFFIDLSEPDSVDYLHSEKPVQFVLKFNEPIEKIEFIGLGRFNAQGACISSGGCRVFTPPEDPGPNDPILIKEDEDKTYIIELAGSQLQGLNGKYTLTVKAIDKNNHRDGTDGDDSTIGAELDATPGTPARRNLFKVEEDPKSNHYPWHQKDEATGNEAEQTANENFSYDFEGGDINHTLLIDTAHPSTVIDVNTTLPN